MYVRIFNLSHHNKRLYNRISTPLNPYQIDVIRMFSLLSFKDDPILKKFNPFFWNKALNFEKDFSKTLFYQSKYLLSFNDGFFEDLKILNKRIKDYIFDFKIYKWNSTLNDENNFLRRRDDAFRRIENLSRSKADHSTLIIFNGLDFNLISSKYLKTWNLIDGDLDPLTFGFEGLNGIYFGSRIIINDNFNAVFRIKDLEYIIFFIISNQRSRDLNSFKEFYRTRKRSLRQRALYCENIHIFSQAIHSLGLSIFSSLDEDKIVSSHIKKFNKLDHQPFDFERKLGLYVKHVKLIKRNVNNSRKFKSILDKRLSQIDINEEKWNTSILDKYLKKIFEEKNKDKNLDIKSISHSDKYLEDLTPAFQSFCNGKDITRINQGNNKQKKEEENDYNEQNEDQMKEWGYSNSKGYTDKEASNKLSQIEDNLVAGFDNIEDPFQNTDFLKGTDKKFISEIYGETPKRKITNFAWSKMLESTFGFEGQRNTCLEPFLGNTQFRYYSIDDIDEDSGTGTILSSAVQGTLDLLLFNTPVFKIFECVTSWESGHHRFPFDFSFEILFEPLLDYFDDFDLKIGFEFQPIISIILYQETGEIYHSTNIIGGFYKNERKSGLLNKPLIKNFRLIKFIKKWLKQKSKILSRTWMGKKFLQLMLG